jgi:hypothetical protein
MEITDAMGLYNRTQQKVENSSVFKSLYVICIIFGKNVKQGIKKTTGYKIIEFFQKQNREDKRFGKSGKGGEVKKNRERERVRGMENA